MLRAYKTTPFNHDFLGYFAEKKKGEKRMTEGIHEMPVVGAHLREGGERVGGLREISREYVDEGGDSP